MRPWHDAVLIQNLLAILSDHAVCLVPESEPHARQYMIHVKGICYDVPKQNVIFLPLLRQLNEDNPEQHLLRIRHSEHMRNTKQLKWQIGRTLCGDDTWQRGQTVKEKVASILKQLS